MMEILARLKTAYANKAGMALSPSDVRDLAWRLELFKPKVGVEKQMAELMPRVCRNGVWENDGGVR